MKKYFAILSVWLIAATTSAQGLVNFANTPTTLVSAGWPGYETVVSGLPGTWLFGLLIAPVGTTARDQFVFTAVYATNQITPGTLYGGMNVPVVPWAPGVRMSYEIAAWSPSMGQLYEPGWLQGDFRPNAEGFFGVSAIGTGVAGGFDGTSNLPPLDLFGGPTGIQSGFNITHMVWIPEPSCAALAALGVATLLLYRGGLRKAV